MATAGAWWAVTGSNRRPSRCKRDALPTELTARMRPWGVDARRCAGTRRASMAGMRHRAAGRCSPGHPESRNSPEVICSLLRPAPSICATGFRERRFEKKARLWAVSRKNSRFEGRTGILAVIKFEIWQGGRTAAPRRSARPLWTELAGPWTSMFLATRAGEPRRCSITSPGSPRLSRSWVRSRPGRSARSRPRRPSPLRSAPRPCPLGASPEAL